MNNAHRILLFVMVPIAFFAGVTQAPGTEAGDDSDRVRQEFESRCPKPQWWDRVSISGVSISTYDDLIAYWQDKNRSKSQFFKAAYTAVLDYPLDEDIVVTAISLMNYTRGYPNRIEMQEYAVERYFSYKNPNGKSGNTVAGIVRNLGNLYNDGSKYHQSVRLIERLLREREPEINHHILELLHLTYAAALKGQNRTEEAIRILEGAVAKYEGSWEKRLKETIVSYGGTVTTTPPPVATTRASYKKKGEKPWWKSNVFIIAGVAVGVLLIIVLRGGSESSIDMSDAHGPSGQGTDADVERLVMERRKVAAVKLYRSIHKVGLMEAKQAVDEIAGRIRSMNGS